MQTDTHRPLSDSPLVYTMLKGLKGSTEAPFLSMKRVHVALSLNILWSFNLDRNFKVNGIGIGNFSDVQAFKINISIN